MLTIMELMGETAEVEISFGDKSLRVVFRPDALNAELEDEFHRRAERERYIDALAYYLGQALVDWDVVDEKGKKVKPTYSFLRKLGVQTLMRIFEAIREASGLSDEAEVVKNSGGGSSLAAT